MKKIILFISITTIIIFTMTGCSPAQKNYQEGTKRFLEGNYSEAASQFKSAIQKNPNRAEYYINYGMTLIQLGQYETAMHEFDLAYQDKNIPMVRENNKQIKRGIAIANYYMGQYEEALTLFEEGLNMKELPQLNMDILFYKGQTLGKLGRVEDAIQTFTDLINQDASNHMALSQRAYMYGQLGDYEKSIADYDAAIALKPQEYDYYLGKYYMYTKMGNGEEASNILSQMLEFDVVTIQDEYKLAKIYLYQGEREQALNKLEEVISKGVYEAYYDIGDLYQAEKNYELAIYNYDLYLQNGGKEATVVYNQVAYCYMKLDKYKEALTYLEKGLTNVQGEMWKSFKRNEIISYEKLGQFDVALEKLNELLAHDPEDEDAQREKEFLQIQLRDGL